MKKLLLLLSLFFVISIFNFSYSQNNVGINDNGDSPNPAAILDVKSANKGILIPRMNLADTTNITINGNNIGNSETGLLIFANDAKTFYYWNGLKWIPIISSFNLADGFIINGNNIFLDTSKLKQMFEPLLTKGDITSSSSVITITGGTGAVIGNGTQISIQQASATQDGYLSANDWKNFNNKQDTIIAGNGIIIVGNTIYLDTTKLSGSIKGDLTVLPASVLSITNGTGAVNGTGTQISIQQASATQDGYLSSTDWNKFNNKWSLTGDTLTDPTVNYLGTKDAKDLLFKTNKTERLRILSNGRISINNSSPSIAAQTQIYNNNSDSVALFVRASNNNSYAIYGENKANAGFSAGIMGVSTNPTGYGIYGLHNANNNIGFGIVGSSNSSSGVGAYGEGEFFGGYFVNYGYNSNVSGLKGVFLTDIDEVSGVYGSYGDQSSGIFSSHGFGVHGVSFSTKGIGVVGEDTLGGNTSESKGMQGSGALYGVHGIAVATGPVGSAGVFGQNKRTNGGCGVIGEGFNGVYGYSTINTGYGLYGEGGDLAQDTNQAPSETNQWGTGVIGQALIGVWGKSSDPNNGAGIWSADNIYANWNVYSGGNINAGGNLTAAGVKSFKIDHPLYPENKYLYHFAIESNEVLNMYRGNVNLDKNGEAVITLPAYFDEININFSYNLSPIGAPAPNLYIKEKIKGNKFIIAGGNPNQEISWTVYAERNDKYLRAHPEIKISERDKAINEKGKYLSPELFGKPIESGILYKLKTANVSTSALKRERAITQKSSTISFPSKNIKLPHPHINNQK